MSVITNPSHATDNVIQATADVPDLTLRPFSDAQTSPVLRVQNAAGSTDLSLIRADGVQFVPRLIANINTPAGAYDAFSTDWGDSSDNFVCIQLQSSAADWVGVQPDAVTAGTSSMAFFTVNPAAPVGSRAGFIGQLTMGATIDNAGAQTGSYVTLGCVGSLNTIRLEPNKIGLYGTTPVVQQANASAAGIAGIGGVTYATDAPAIKAALQAIYTALANLGACAATA